MGIGVTVLIVLAVPTLFQIIMQGLERRKQHSELLERLERLEGKIATRGQ